MPMLIAQPKSADVAFVIHAFGIYDKVRPLVPASIRFVINGEGARHASAHFARETGRPDVGATGQFVFARTDPPEAIAARICLECP